MTKRPSALRYLTGGVRKVAHRTATAAECIGRLEPGVRVCGLTAGQFSAIDVLEHIADELGPCDFRVSTWTSGLYDVQRGAEMRQNGKVRNIRMLLDRGTFERSPQYAGALIQAVGAENIRCLSVHAKVTIAHGERGAAVVRSSMNLNKNLRTEQFDIDVCQVMADWYTEWFDALWDESGSGADNLAIITAVFDRFQALPPADAAVTAKKLGGFKVGNPWLGA